MSDQYWILRKGKQTGPFTLEQLKQMNGGGMLLDDDLFSKDRQVWKALRHSKAPQPAEDSLNSPVAVTQESQIPPLPHPTDSPAQVHSPVSKETEMTTEERLENLGREFATAKRRNRWLLAVMGIIIVMMGLVWTLTKATPTVQSGAAARETGVVHARQLILEDDNGKPCFTIAASSIIKESPGPVLMILRQNGTPIANLTGNDKMSILSLSDEKSSANVMLLAGPTGSLLQLTDEKGKKRGLMVGGEDTTALQLLDKSGRLLWSAP